MILRPPWKLGFDSGRSNNITVASVCRATFQSTALRVLVATGISWLLIFNYFKHYAYWREPHSQFFNMDHVYDLHYSQERLDDGKKFFDTVVNQPSWKPSHAAEPVICAAIATVKRKINYLNDTLATMLTTLTPEERSAVNIRLTFASTHPETHPDYDAPWLSVVDEINGYNVSKTDFANLTKWEADDWWIQWKGVYDYAYLLKDCYERSNAPYIAVFEDDIVFAEGWLSKTLNALAGLHEQTQDWIYLRLFYTETYHVFWGNKDFWHTHKRLAYGLGGLATAVLLLLVRGCSGAAQRGISNWTLLVIAFITVPALLNLAFRVPKHSLRGTGLQRLDGACCTQALIFPRYQIMDIVDYLLEKERGQTDLMIETYAAELGLARWAVEPQQVQHIGTVSSRGVNKVDTWAHLFEAYDKDALHKEHEKLAGPARIWRAQTDGSENIE